MSRRERTHTTRCTEDGCKEYTLHGYTTEREYREIIQRQQAKPWKCSRHENPTRNLRPGNETTEQVLVATRVAVSPVPGFPNEPERWLPGLYWRPEDGRTGSGFTHGPGFNAYASDFPEGTRLVVTTRIEMPEEGGHD